MKRKTITLRNPQANAVLERVHQTLGNIIRTFELHEELHLTELEAWQGILAAAAFAIRATYHTTLQHTPSQLVFGRDAILNVQCDVDWTAIKASKQKLIKKNTERENSSRKTYQYHVGDKILVKQGWGAKYAKAPYKGPYQVTRVNTNGTLRYLRGVVDDVINIRNVKPYYE